jgi:hypothetical protein
VVTHDYSLEAVVRRTEAFYGDVTTRRAEAAA